jgi:hypothetical protein
MTKYIRNNNLITADLELDLVMLDIDQGKYYSLDEVGTVIWNLLEKPFSLDELVESLMMDYDVDLETCEKDVSDHIKKLLKLKIIKFSE